MKTALGNDETIVKEGGANLQRGLETVGGHLYLTNKRLVFESHAFNIQQGSTIVDVENITEMTKTWTKFLNLIPIFPNSVCIRTKTGDEFNFVVSNRNSWIQDIENTKKTYTR